MSARLVTASLLCAAGAGLAALLVLSGSTPTLSRSTPTDRVAADEAPAPPDVEWDAAAVAPSPGPGPGPGPGPELPTRPGGFAAWEADALDRLIETASHAEIESALEELVALPVEQSRQIRDLRAFSRRLAEISLEQEEPPRPDARIRDIEFAKSAEGLDSTRRLFLAHEGRIFALFDPGDYRGSHLVIRWTSEDTGKSVTRAVEVEADEAWQSVYLYPRNRDWFLGGYRVDVFSADDDLALLASGRYRVAEDFAPPPL